MRNGDQEKNLKGGRMFVVLYIDGGYGCHHVSILREGDQDCEHNPDGSGVVVSVVAITTDHGAAEKAAQKKREEVGLKA